MNKTEFREKYRISDASPIDPIKKLLSATSFAEALEKFINDNFRGAAECEYNSIPEEKILVNLEYTAFFIKNLLCSVFGRTYVKFKISGFNGGISMSVASECELPLSYEETNVLIRNARDAGFEINITEHGFTLKLSFAKAKAHFVYATESLDGPRAIIGKLSEVCFLNTKD